MRVFARRPRVWLPGFALLASFLALPAVAQAQSYVLSVEYVEISLGAGQTMNSAGLTKGQTIANCVHFASLMTTGVEDDFDRFFTDVYFEAGPQVTARREVSGGTVDLGVYVVEFDPTYVTVQQNSTELSFAGTSTTTGITSVDTAKAAMVFYYRGSFSTHKWRDHAVAGWFSAADTLSFQRDLNDGTVYVHWYVFEAKNPEFSVQPVSLSIAGGADFGTASISSVDLTKSFVIGSYRSAYDDDNVRSSAAIVYLSSATEVRAERDFDSGLGISDIRAFVVELSGNASVERGSLSYSDTGTQQTATVASVSTDDSIVWNGMSTGPGVIRTSEGTATEVETAFQRIKLTDATTVQGDRGEGSVDGTYPGDGIGRFEVIDFSGVTPPPTGLYRSVGTNGADLNTTSRTVEITGTTATFSGPMPNNIGVGDVLQYNDGSFRLAFIHGRSSDTVYTVQSASGGTPQAVAAGTAVAVHRAYTSLFDWERQFENPSFDISVRDFDTSTNLAGDNTVMNVAGYGDGEDVTSVNISGWTTAPGNYIRIYTPTSTSDVGASQRHDGKWDTTSAYRISNTLNTEWVIRVEERYVRIDGIQVDFQRAPATPQTPSTNIAGIDVKDGNADAAVEFHISNNIVRQTFGAPAQDEAFGILALDNFLTPDNSLYVAKVWNNIVYGFVGTAATRGIHADNQGTIYAYNNTVIGDGGAASQSLGFDGSGANSSAFFVKNNIAIDATDPYSDLATGAGSNNNVSDTGDAPPAGARNCEPAFVNKAGDDYHLSAADPCARDFGADLSADSNLAFVDDIDDETRPTNWDIGADENGAAGTMQVLSGVFVGDGIGPRSIYVGFQPDVVILKRDSGLTSSAVRTSTMVGDVTKDGDQAGAAVFADGITSLDATGFTVGADARVNASGDTHYWVAFKAGTGEMKVGTYTGDGFDDRSVTGVDFQLDYVMTLPEGAFSPFHRTSTMPGDQSYDFDATQWGPPGNRIQALEADGFQVGDHPWVNGGGATYHYIAWKAAAGRMALGTYTGDGNDDRILDIVGFPSEWVLVKPENSFRPWVHKPASTGVSTDYSIWLSDAGGFPGANNLIQALRPLGFEVGDGVWTNESLTLYHWIAFAGEKLSQIHYRWRNDDGNEAAATWAAGEDTKLTGLAKGDTRRVRFEVSNEGAASSIPVTYELQVAEAATCSLGSYTAVPTDTSGHWQVIGSANLTDGEATSNVAGGLFDEASTFVAGEAKDAGKTTGSITLNLDEFTEIEFAVQATTNATDLGDYCFRLVDSSSGNPLDSYSAYAEVSVAPGTLTLANHDAGQIGDQFSTTTPVTLTELFAFKLSTTGTVTVDNIRVHFSTGGGVVNGDVTNGDLYRDENDDGLIDGGDTPLATGVAATGGFLSFTSLVETPGAGGANYLVQADVANLVAGDTTTFSIQTADIDEVESGVAESGSAGFAVHTFDSVSGGDVFYSVGTSRPTPLQTGAPTITVINGTATLSEPQTGNVGVGDEITYNGATKVYIKSVISQTQFVVYAPAGGVPVDVDPAVAVDSIMRAFADISTAEANSGDGTHLAAAGWPADTDLTAAGVNANLTWVAYNDGAFTAGATIDGYTTDATHFITLTVAGALQVASGTSQRHNGTAGTGVVLDGQDTDQGIRVKDDDTTVEWFEFKRNRGGMTAVSVEVRDASNVLLQNLLIYDFDDVANFVAGIKGEDNSSYTVRNCIIYDGDSAAIRNQNVTTTGTVENCTLYGSQRGVKVDAGTMTVTNTIALGNTTADFEGTMTGSYNMSTDGTAFSVFASDPNAITGASSAVEFVDDNFVTADLHLASTASAINAGVNLSGNFTDDIDDETRAANWDIGADETGGTVNYRSIGTRADYSTNDVTATNGSTVVTGNNTFWLTNNRGRGDRITLEGVNYTILSVDSETQLTLTTTYMGTGGSGLTYNISRKFQTLQDWEDCISFGSARTPIAPGGLGGNGLGPYAVPAGSDRVLSLTSAYEDNNSETSEISATFGGVPMTRIVSQIVQVGSDTARVALFILKDADILPGPQMFVVTNGTPLTERHTYGDGINIDQTSPVVDTRSGTVLAGDTVATQAAFRVVQDGSAAAWALSGNSGSYDDTQWGSGWFEANDFPFGSATLASAGKFLAASGTEIGTATFVSGANYQVMIAIGMAPTGSCEGVYSADLRADGRKEVGIAYNDSAVPVDPDFTARVVIDGSTTDADHDITLTADGDNRHYGIAGQGVVIDLGGVGNDAIQVEDDFVTVEWMEVTNTAFGREAIQVNNGLAAGTSSLVVLRSNLIHDVGGCGVAIYDDDGRVDVYNNFVYSNDQCGLYLDPVSLLPGSRFRVLNNTFYANVSNGINKVLGASAAATLLLRGNISVFNGALDFRGDPLDSVDPASSHNLSSDGTAAAHSNAGGDVDEPVLANLNFVSTTPGSEDLHITSGSAAELAGADLSAIFSWDIDGGNRVAPWDIGADEIEATTAVELLSFEAFGVEGAVELRWETGSELDNLGFHLYRSLTEEGLYDQITVSVIPGLGSSPEGAQYAYRDSGLVNGTTYYYQLEDIETTGKTEMHGPVTATPAVGATLPEEPDGDGSTPRITYGDPSANGLRVLERSRNGIVLELVTEGFYAIPQEDGSVAIEIPGFEGIGEANTPSIPVKHHWVDAVAGRKVELRSVRGSMEAVTSAWAVSSEHQELVARARGTVKARQRRRRANAWAEGLFPAEAARVVTVAFQGESKKALVEMAPVRWSADTGELFLARRLVVRLSFRGVEPSEQNFGGNRGRRRSRKLKTIQGILARLVTTERGLHGIRYEDVFGTRGRLRVDGLRLSRQGEDVAFHVEPANGWFRRGSRLYFLGDGADANPYGMEAVYEGRLHFGGAAGVRGRCPTAPGPPR